MDERAGNDAGRPTPRYVASVVRAIARGSAGRVRRSLEARSRVPSSARSNTPARSALARRHCNPASDGGRAQTPEARRPRARSLGRPLKQRRAGWRPPRPKGWRGRRIEEPLASRRRRTAMLATASAGRCTGRGIGPAGRQRLKPLLGVVRAGGWRRLLGGEPCFVGCREQYRVEWWCREPQRDDPSRSRRSPAGGSCSITMPSASSLASDSMAAMNPAARTTVTASAPPRLSHRVLSARFAAPSRRNAGVQERSPPALQGDQEHARPTRSSCLLSHAALKLDNGLSIRRRSCGSADPASHAGPMALR